MAVLAISIAQQYVAGPLGLSWGLSRESVVLASFFGGMIGVVAIVIAGQPLVDKVTSFFRRLFRRPPKITPEEDKPPGRFARLVDRFGTPVLGIGGPLTIGGWAAAALGVANGIGIRRSTKFDNLFARMGCCRARTAFVSICRTRSRVTWLSRAAR